MRISNIILSMVLVTANLLFAEPHEISGSNEGDSATRAVAPKELSKVIPKARIIENPDGQTVMVTLPRFESEDGEVYRVSGFSDPDGICKKYGFASAVKGEKVKSLSSIIFKRELTENSKDETELFAVINSNGQLTSILNGGSYYMKIVACRKTEESMTAPKFDKNNYEKLVEDPITKNVTVINPNFGKFQGIEWRFNANSDLDALCESFGYSGGAIAKKDDKTKVELSPIENYGTSVLINSSGRMTRFARWSSWSSWSPQDDSTLTQITCAP